MNLHRIARILEQKREQHPELTQPLDNECRSLLIKAELCFLAFVTFKLPLSHSLLRVLSA